jgi:hypothetical protein
MRKTMAKRKAIPYAILTPKHDAAKKRLSYHGKQWIIKHIEDETEFHSGDGPWLRVMSMDGKKYMIINALKDPDFKLALK